MTTFTVNSGTTTSGTTLNSGDVLNISTGGTASGTIVNNGGTENDYGTASGTTVNNGGVENDNGTVTGSSVNEGGLENVVGVADSITVDGGTANINGGSGRNSTVRNGGVLSVYRSASVTGTTVNAGGTLQLGDAGTDSATVVNGGGSENVGAGGIASGTVVNNGGYQTISIGGTASDTVLNAGGTVSNAGTISSTTGEAVLGTGAGVSVRNTGNISSTSDAGVWLDDGGLVANSGIISGLSAAVAMHSAGTATVTNAASGALTGGNQGVYSDAGTSVTLTNSGTISATTAPGTGVLLVGGGTVTNFGTITGGSSGYAVQGVNRLILEAGQIMNGVAQAASGATDTVLDLGAAGTGAGTLFGLGTNYVGFQTVQVDAGASWTVAAAGQQGAIDIQDNAALILTGNLAQGSAINLGATDTLTLDSSAPTGATIGGLAVSDAIVLSSLAYAPSETVSVSGDTVTVGGGGVSQVLTIAGAQNDIFALSDAPGGTRLTLVSPNITALASEADAAGPLDAGHVITFALTSSAALTVANGTPTLALSDGGTATLDAAATTSTMLVFTTTVAAGQNASDLKVTGLTLNGASITAANGLALDASSLSTLAGADTGIVVDTTPPAVTATLVSNPLDANSNGITYSPILAGGGDPGAAITISEGGQAIGTAQANMAGAWTYDPSGLAPGAHTLVASETDAAGNTGSTVAAPLTVPGPRFDVQDVTTSTSGAIVASAYSGPVNYLQAQYVYSDADSLVLAATVPNVFMKGGSGEDALVAKSGSNVLDGGTSSTWMAGASGADGGADTFFVDGRGSQPIWDTLLNFHTGDTLTLWGYDSAAGSTSWSQGQGASDYRGTTLHADFGAGLGSNALVTFAGLTTSNAQFATSTGTIGGLGYLLVTRTA